MLSFEQVNVNPKNKKTGDCVVRAITMASGFTYKEVATMLFNEWMKSGYEMTDKHTVNKVLSDLGFIFHKKPARLSGKTYQVKDMDQLLDPGESAVLQVANHYTCAKDNMIYDLWDCRSKSVYGYWTKGE